MIIAKRPSTIGAFGIEEHGVCKGKKFLIKILSRANAAKIIRSKLFRCYLATHFPAVAAMKETIVDFVFVDGNILMKVSIIVLLLRRIYKYKHSKNISDALQEADE